MNNWKINLSLFRCTAISLVGHYFHAQIHIDTQRHTDQKHYIFHYITKPWSHKGPSDIWGQHTFSAKLNNF